MENPSEIAVSDWTQSNSNARSDSLAQNGESESDWLESLAQTQIELLDSEVRPRSQGFLPAKPPGDLSWSIQHGGPVQSEKLVLSQENPFKGLKISSTELVNEQPVREPCPKCFKSREVEGKSTAVHAAVLAPHHVKMFTFPNIPDYTTEKAVLVFPGNGSRRLEQILESCAQEENLQDNGSSEGASNTNFGFTKIVFIDSTWNQCYGMVQHPGLAGLPRVEISSRRTIFWRYQKGKPKEYLATIEAIYYFLVDFHCIVLNKKYGGEYDNILFLFKFMYDKIHELYDHDSLRAYTRD